MIWHPLGSEHLGPPSGSSVYSSISKVGIIVYTRSSCTEVTSAWAAVLPTVSTQAMVKQRGYVINDTHLTILVLLSLEELLSVPSRDGHCLFANEDQGQLFENEACTSGDNREVYLRWAVSQETPLQ